MHSDAAVAVEWDGGGSLCGSSQEAAGAPHGRDGREVGVEGSTIWATPPASRSELFAPFQPLIDFP